MPLTPSGQWILEAADSSCLLQRDYGSGSSKITFGGRRMPLDTVADVFVVAKAGSSSRSGHVKIGSWQGYFEAGRLPNGAWLMKAKIPVPALDELMAASQLHVAFEGAPANDLDQNGVGAAVAAERSCEARVLKSWGIEPADLNKVATAPVADRPETWITEKDYPSQALIQHLSGAVTMVWQIDLAGRATNCKIVESSGVPYLDEGSCQLILSRARYRPALDAAAQPVISWALRHVRWVSPR